MRKIYCLWCYFYREEAPSDAGYYDNSPLEDLVPVCVLKDRNRNRQIHLKDLASFVKIIVTVLPDVDKTYNS